MLSGWTKGKSTIYDEVEENNRNQLAAKTLVNFSMFTESGEIGAIALKASSLIEIELHHSMK